jgi:signal peptidase II
MTSSARWPFLIVGVLAILLVDQATKTLVVRSLVMYESVQPIPALYPVFQVTRSFNTGAAFGIFAGTVWAGRIFLVIAFVVSVILGWGYRKLTDRDWDARIATVMVVGGALGNAIDRVIYGHVVDFIHYTIPGVVSNVSNLADHAIVFGVFLMIWASWRAEEQETAEATPTDKDAGDTSVT